MPNMPLLNRLTKAYEIECGMLLLTECQALKQKGCHINLMASELTKILTQDQLNLLTTPIPANQLERLLLQCAADLIEKKLCNEWLSRPQHQLLTLIEQIAIREYHQPFRSEYHAIAEQILALVKYAKTQNTQ